jgi:nicotinic acetylcholine receptor, invertebrate
MHRPGHDLSWRAIRHRRSRTLERQNSVTSVHKYPPTPLLAHSSKSLLANVTGMDDQSYVSTSHTLPNSVMNHIVARQGSKCKNPNHHHEPTDVLLPRDMRVFRADMRTILTELKFLTGHVRQEEEEDDVSQDWKFSAMVIDRLCLIIFTLTTTIFSYVTLFSAPNFFKLR